LDGVVASTCVCGSSDVPLIGKRGREFLSIALVATIECLTLNEVKTIVLSTGFAVEGGATV
jgi:hypothetical protein